MNSYKIIDKFFRGCSDDFTHTLCYSLGNVVSRGLEEIPDATHEEIIAGIGLFIAMVGKNDRYFPYDVARAADYAMAYTAVPEEEKA